MMHTMKALFESLQHRLRPEDVAELVLAELDDLTNHERQLLKNVAQCSLKRGVFAMTSMAADFQKPVAPIRQVNKAQELFKDAYKLSEVDCANPKIVLGLIRRISLEIYKQVGKNDFKDNRLNKLARKQRKLDISRRRYNKLFRFLARFEQKVDKYIIEQDKFQATCISKSGLANQIDNDDFCKSRDAACFVAYFTARRNRRSVFTNESQDRAFDDVSKMLYDRFTKKPRRAGWRIIARVMPDFEVISKLTDKDKMELLITWLDVLSKIASMLATIWIQSKFDRATMIVSKGDDSTTWNALAGAWNTARQSWMSLMFTLDMRDELDKICFGKVMRLMAADVVAWHRSSGGNVEPDTLVWADLPAPWDVFSGKAICTRSKVEDACNKYNVDPIKKNWTYPIQKREAVAFKPTPELVHGVMVSHPALAKIIRKAGWFSGKKSRPIAENVIIHRENGFATNVELDSM